MRVFIALTAVIMIPVLVLVHLVTYNDEMRPILLRQIQADLERTGIQKSSAHLSYLDASIYGIAPNFEVREQASAAVSARQGVRLLMQNNHITVPAQLEISTTADTLVLSGWLPSENDVQTAINLIGAFRPDLTLDVKKLRISPIVTLVGEETELTLQHPLVEPLIEKLRLPAALEVTRDHDTYRITGRVPGEELKDAIIKTAAAHVTNGEVDGTALMAGVCVREATFTQGDALLDFIRSFFSTPTPGTFSLGDKGLSYIKADATAELKAEWMPLFRTLSGTAEITSEIRIYPAPYLLPGYRPQITAAESELQPLIATLAETRIYFDPASSELGEVEIEKLKVAVPTMKALGSELQLVISSWGGSATETIESQRARAEAVKSKLAELGISKQQMEIVEIGTLYPDRSLQLGDDDTSRPRVELLAR